MGVVDDLCVGRRRRASAIATGGFALLFAYENWLEYPKIMVVYWLFAAYTLRLLRQSVKTMHLNRTSSST